MRVFCDYHGCVDQIVDVYRTAFSAAEGPEAGHAVAGLARDLIIKTPKTDLRVFHTADAGFVSAAIMFTTLDYPEDTRDVMLLSPVAVAPRYQGKRIGPSLIRLGLEHLRRDAVDVVLTYGDPKFYRKVGFAPITTRHARPPLPLSQPEGWLGQSLLHEGFARLMGPSKCVPALHDPLHW